VLGATLAAVGATAGSAVGVTVGAAAGAGCATTIPPPSGGHLGAGRASTGHRVRQPVDVSQTTGAPQATDVAIVGAGVAGLTAAWRLRRGGFAGTITLLDLSDRPGGTSASAHREDQVFPLGAHYITLPSPECRHMRALLAELGVITDLDPDGRPRYDPTALCHAPQERLFIGGSWWQGLWPGDGASAADHEEYEDFQERCAQWTDRLGDDGLPAFAIPVASSSRDPRIRALTDRTMSQWMEERGYTSERLRWLIDYACRDDYGASIDETSAWAGLHYHCSRRPDPSTRDLATHVLTWPEGNGWLVARLMERARAAFVPGALVRKVEPDTGRLWVEEGGALRRLDARHIVLAVPARVVDRLVERPAGLRADLAPWRVAQLHCRRMPFGRGLSVAWDSVIYGGRGLGYVSNRHQTSRGTGPVVLTWYQPLTGPPAQGRRSLLEAEWSAEVDDVLGELSPAHPDLREVVERVDILHWGHGTARPVVGLHSVGALDGAAERIGRVRIAHADLSGISLFEEAAWHGVRAAEDILGEEPTASPGESLL